MIFPTYARPNTNNPLPAIGYKSEVRRLVTQKNFIAVAAGIGGLWRAHTRATRRLRICRRQGLATLLDARPPLASALLWLICLALFSFLFSAPRSLYTIFNKHQLDFESDFNCHLEIYSP